MSGTLETRYLEGFVRPHEWGALQEQVDAAHQPSIPAPAWAAIFLGWLSLPTDYDKEEFARIQTAAGASGKIRIFSSSSVSAVPTWAPGQLSNS